MNLSAFQAVMVTGFLCCVTGFAVLCFQERRSERKQFRRDEEWRQVMWQRGTGAAPPVLSDEERAAFGAITARLKRDERMAGSEGSERP